MESMNYTTCNPNKASITFGQLPKCEEAGIEQVIANPTLLLAEVCQVVRQFLWKKGYTEFFSPVIRAHDCCDIVPRLKLADGRYLQESPALALRRNLSLSPKIFSIAPCFRNDKVDPTHLQQFYMLDLYRQDADLGEISQLFKELVSLFFTGSFEYISIADKILHDFDINLYSDAQSIEKLHQKLSELYGPEALLFPLLDRWMTEEVEPLSMGKCLIAYDFPHVAEARAKLKTGSIAVTERIEFLIEGIEVVHLYQDDPDVAGLVERAKKHGHCGPEETILLNLVDSHVISPYSAGGAIGLERLCAVCLGLSNINGFIQSPEFVSPIDLPS